MGLLSLVTGRKAAREMVLLSSIALYQGLLVLCTITGQNCVGFSQKKISDKRHLPKKKKKKKKKSIIYLFGVLCRFQHCTGYITTGSFVGRGNQYIQLVSRFLYCKLPAISKQLPTFHQVQGLNHRPQRWEASVLPSVCYPSHSVVFLNRGIYRPGNMFIYFLGITYYA